MANRNGYGQFRSFLGFVNRDETAVSLHPRKHAGSASRPRQPHKLLVDQDVRRSAGAEQAANVCEQPWG